jgi:hypothetical protein
MIIPVIIAMKATPINTENTMITVFTFYECGFCRNSLDFGPLVHSR